MIYKIFEYIHPPKINLPMKRLLLLLLILVSVHSFAQDIRSLTWSFRPYPDVETAWTPAPAGYKPVYLSNFSRHGSRYLSSAESYTAPLAVLEAAGRDGALSEMGASLLEDVRKIAADAAGKEGMLLPRGGREHRHIMERTVARYPDLFRGNDCRIDVYSSTSQRCLMSMAYSLDAITAKNPRVRYDRHVGPGIQAEVFNSYPVSDVHHTYGDALAARELEEGACEALLDRIFTGGEAGKARYLDAQGRKQFVRYLWELTIDNALNDELGIDLYKYFTYSDFYGAWRAVNWREYFIIGPSAEYGEIVRNEASTTLRHMIEHADRALAGGPYRATLRYGHDSQMAPLAVAMDIEGCSAPVADPAHPEAAWILDEICPMCGNIQLVFFRKNGSSDILVKVLLNERESRIAGVETDRWPFYHWSDLRAHYLASIDGRPDFNRGGWQTEEVAEGVVYERYSGVDPVSGVHQLVHAVAADANRFATVASADADGATASDALRKAGALATVSATYRSADGVRHPAVRDARTALLETADGRLVLVVVDGGRPNIAEGMTGAELSAFLEAHFRPRRIEYLDDGETSTLCVRGLGTAETDVVNYPSASRTFLHDGEWKAPAHVHILAR